MDFGKTESVSNGLMKRKFKALIQEGTITQAASKPLIVMSKLRKMLILLDPMALMIGLAKLKRNSQSFVQGQIKTSNINDHIMASGYNNIF